MNTYDKIERNDYAGRSISFVGKVIKWAIYLFLTTILCLLLAKV